MISSALDKPYRKIIVDRLKMPIGNGKEILLTDPEEILEHAPDAYIPQFRKRDHGFMNLPEEWENIYKPLDKVNLAIYDTIDECPSSEEWADALASCKSSSAPGASTIGYNVPKKLSPDTQQIFRLYAGWCYTL